MTKKSLLTAAVAATTGLAMVLGACGSRVGEEGSSAAGSCVDTSGDTIKVGFINSLSGTFAMSETAINNALNLAADEINADGGVMGYELEVVEEDGASEPSTFAERAERLVAQECVAALFGGWSSASRQAVIPIVERNNAMLFYPAHYEGMETSPNIVYTGATPNQHILPVLEHLADEGELESIFMVGSDYVYPRTTFMVARQFAEERDIEVLGEEYVPLAATDFTTVMNRIGGSDADVILSSVQGDSMVSFYQQYSALGLSPDEMPILHTSQAEEEIAGIGLDNAVDHLTSVQYYQTLDSPENDAFVDAYTDSFGGLTSDGVQNAYGSMFLWKEMVEEAESFETDDIRAVADGTSFEAPGGTMVIDGETQHVSKVPRLGRVEEDGLIHVVWEGDEAIPADPHLTGYDWIDEEEVAELSAEAE